MDTGDNKLLLSLYQHLLVMKTFHFQTSIAFRHVKTDEYLNEYLSNMDKMMEILQGISSPVTVREMHFDIQMRTDDDIVEELDDMIVILEQERGRTSSVDALIDEMQGNLQRLVYLLGFR